MQTIMYPTFAITNAKKLGSENISDARSGMLIEIWDETPSTPVLMKRLWNKDGAAYGADNHPSGSSFSVADNSIIRVELYHLATHNIMMQGTIINSDTGITGGDTNVPSTYPKGMVDGAGDMGSGAIPLYKAIKAGTKSTFRFQAKPQTTAAWYKINCNIWFGDASGLSSVDPNNGTVYGTNIFQIDYYGGTIRWPNPTVIAGNQVVLDNTALWPTENSFSQNQWYKENTSYVGCSKLKNGLLLSTWNNAGDGVNTLQNQPFETWDFGWNGYRVLKVLTRASDGITPKSFELRGKDAYKSFLPYAANIDGTEVDCSNLLGSNIGLSIDTSVTSAIGYTKSGNVFSLSTSLCPLPQITIVASDTLIKVGGVLTLSANANNATSYQWYKDNQIILGAIEDTYVKNNCNLSDVGKYYCKAINDCGSPNTASQANSNEITIGLASNLFISFPVTLQGSCNGGVERGYSTTNNINSVTKWYAGEDIPLTQHGNYYFFARMIANNAEYVVTGLINTETLKIK